MKFGTRFKEELARQISSCDIVLVVIGPKWLEIVQKRQNEANDYVRIEIETALEQNKVVIPVFIEDAAIPRVDQLPKSLQELPGLHAARLRSERFSDDCAGLIDDLHSKRRDLNVGKGTRGSVVPVVLVTMLILLVGVGIYQSSTKTDKQDVSVSNDIDASEAVVVEAEDVKIVECREGREQVDGICCWGGQENLKGKCVNRPRYCPPGKGIIGDSCETIPNACPEDKIVLAGTALCCYLGQKEQEGRCAGEPAAANVDISTNRSDALIYVDKKRKGRGSVKNIKLKANQVHTVVVRWKKENIKRELQAKPGKSYELYLPLSETSKTAEQKNTTKQTVPISLPKNHKNMVKVPAGSFYYGCHEEVDNQCFDDEKPGRREKLDTFWIDKYEVPVDDYKSCVEAKKCSTEGLKKYSSCNWGKPNKGKHPINCVDWQQAKTYCLWLGKDLANEKQWEKAARGTKGLKYPWGNVHYRDLGNKLVANIDSDEVEGYDDGYKYTSPVDSFQEGKSPYGALNMVGNVWEWTDSWYQNNTSRVVRGGSWNFWNSDDWFARASVRGAWGPSNRGNDLGFRCVSQ